MNHVISTPCSSPFCREVTELPASLVPGSLGGRIEAFGRCGGCGRRIAATALSDGLGGDWTTDVPLGGRWSTSELTGAASI